MKWANKKHKNFNIYNVVFQKKNKEKHLEISLLYICTPKSQWYDLQFLRYRAWRTEIASVGSFFALWPPLKTPKIKILKKKIAGDIIILHMYTKNHNHRDVEWQWQNFLSFWVIFCPFTSLTTWTIKILKRWKKHLDMSSFYTCVPKIMITWCMVPEKSYVMDGQTDGQKRQKKWHIEVGAPPKKIK